MMRAVIVLSCRSSGVSPLNTSALFVFFSNGKVCACERVVVCVCFFPVKCLLFYQADCKLLLLKSRENFKKNKITKRAQEKVFLFIYFFFAANGFPTPRPRPHYFDTLANAVCIPVYIYIYISLYIYIYINLCSFVVRNGRLNDLFKALRRKTNLFVFV